MLVRRPIVRIFHERKFLRPPIRLVLERFAPLIEKFSLLKAGHG